MHILTIRGLASRETSDSRRKTGAKSPAYPRVDARPDRQAPTPPAKYLARPASAAHNDPGLQKDQLDF